MGHEARCRANAEGSTGLPIPLTRQRIAAANTAGVTTFPGHIHRLSISHFLSSTGELY